jgi:hypothetical protein
MVLSIRRFAAELPAASLELRLRLTDPCRTDAEAQLWPNAQFGLDSY